MSGTIMQSLAFIIFMLPEKIKIIKFLAQAGLPAGKWPNTEYYIDSFFHVSQQACSTNKQTIPVQLQQCKERKLESKPIIQT